ncbi:MAG: hypothetical protein IKI03_08750 [Clostridia bacterium]|nr:hypothetical protein [Clostridia bacterium]
MTALEDLWYEIINPHETYLSGNCRFKHLLSPMGKNWDKLSNTLTEQQKESFEKYGKALNEMYCLAEQVTFQYEFSLGVKLMMEWRSSNSQ